MYSGLILGNWLSTGAVTWLVATYRRVGGLLGEIVGGVHAPIFIDVYKIVARRPRTDDRPADGDVGQR